MNLSELFRRIVRRCARMYDLMILESDGCLVYRRDLMDRISVRKAANLTPAQAMTLIADAEAWRAVVPSDVGGVQRDLQCLLDIHHAVAESPHETFGALYRKRPDLALTAVYVADRAMRKRGM